MKRIILILTALCLLLALGACGASAQPESDPRPDKTPKPKPTEEPIETAAPTETPPAVDWSDAAAASVTALRQDLHTDGGALGVCFLGCAGEYSGCTLEELFAEATALYPLEDYMYELDRCHVAEMPGEEVYLLVPVSEDAAVTVYEQLWGEDTKDGQPRRGEPVYAAAPGEVLLVRGNVSDMISNLEIVLEQDGEELLVYHPGLSLRDGSVLTAPGVVDFTCVDVCTEANDCAESGKGMVRLLGFNDDGTISFSIRRFLFITQRDTELIAQYGLPEDLNGYDFEIVYPDDYYSVYLVDPEACSFCLLDMQTLQPGETDADGLCERMLEYDELPMYYEVRTDGMLLRLEQIYTG